MLAGNSLKMGVGAGLEISSIFGNSQLVIFPFIVGKIVTSTSHPTK